MLYEPCPNPRLLDLVHRGWARLLGHLRDSTFASSPAARSDSVEEHAEHPASSSSAAPTRSRSSWPPATTAPRRSTPTDPRHSVDALASRHLRTTDGGTP